MEDGEYPTLPLRPLSQPTQTGESIYHWGYPFGGKLSDDLNELQPSLFQGYISSTQTSGDEHFLEEINYVLPVKYIWERVVTQTETEQEKGDNA